MSKPPVIGSKKHKPVPVPPALLEKLLTKAKIKDGIRRKQGS